MPMRCLQTTSNSPNRRTPLVTGQHLLAVVRATEHREQAPMPASSTDKDTALPASMQKATLTSVSSVTQMVPQLRTSASAALSTKQEDTVPASLHGQPTASSPTFTLLWSSTFPIAAHAMWAASSALLAVATSLTVAPSAAP